MVGGGRTSSKGFGRFCRASWACSLGSLKMRIQGLGGLVTSTKAIGADFCFVAQSLYLGIKHLPQVSRSLETMSVGVGLGAMVLPKTILYPFFAPFR